MSNGGLDGANNNYAGKFRTNFGVWVSFPTLPTLTAQPATVRIIQQSYRHDLAQITFDKVSQTYLDLLNTGVPVKVDYQHTNDKKSWYGYVSFVSEKVASQKLQPMVIMCLGTTFPLKERTTRVFINSTISEAVQSIVEENGFRFIGDPSERRFSQLAIAGHSYWEWIVEQAQRIGFGVAVDGTDFYFRELSGMINQGVAGAPVLRLGDQNVAPRSQMSASPTLDSFESIKGEFIESDLAPRTVKNVGGVDPNTMLPHFQSASPTDLTGGLRSNLGDTLFQEFTGDVSDSSLTAAQSARGAAELARLTVPGKATAQGNPKITPFSTVFVQNTGSSTDGYWVVRRSEHILRRTGGEYTLALDLATDGIGTSSPSPFRMAAPGAKASINIAEALNRTASFTTPSGSADPVLTTYSPTIGADNQGFLRTPARWTAPRRS